MHGIKLGIKQRQLTERTQACHPGSLHWGLRTPRLSNVLTTIPPIPQRPCWRHIYGTQERYLRRCKCHQISSNITQTISQGLARRCDAVERAGSERNKCPHSRCVHTSWRRVLAALK
jgi:hypothetical protein